MLNETIKDFNDNWRSYILWGLFWALLLVPVSIVFLIGAFRKSPEGEKRLAILNQITNETPLYPNLQKLHSSQGAKDDRAIITIGYRVPATTNYNEVRGFYIRELTSKGWKFSPEETPYTIIGDSNPRLVFKKGEYQISITWYDYEPAECSISYYWEKS